MNQGQANIMHVEDYIVQVLIQNLSESYFRYLSTRKVIYSHTKTKVIITKVTIFLRRTTEGVEISKWEE